MGIEEIKQMHPQIASFADIEPAEFLKKEVQKEYNLILTQSFEGETSFDKLKAHMEMNCQVHFGMGTKEVKEWGKKIGLKAGFRNSAREVFRNVYPEIAASMSLVDILVGRCGYETEQAAELSKAIAMPDFKVLLSDWMLTMGCFIRIRMEEIEKMRPK